MSHSSCKVLNTLLLVFSPFSGHHWHEAGQGSQCLFLLLVRQWFFIFYCYFFYFIFFISVFSLEFLGCSWFLPSLFLFLSGEEWCYSSIFRLDPFLPSQSGHWRYQWDIEKKKLKFLRKKGFLEVQQKSSSWQTCFRKKRCLFSRLCACPSKLQQMLQKMWVCPGLLCQLMLHDSTTHRLVPFPPYQG